MGLFGPSKEEIEEDERQMANMTEQEKANYLRQMGNTWEMQQACACHIHLVWRCSKRKASRLIRALRGLLE